MSNETPHTIKNILEVQGYGSAVDTTYKILAPLQMTVESCSGLGKGDHYSIMLVSTLDHWLRNEGMDIWFQNFNARTSHRHDYFELLIVLEGEITQRIEGKDYVYRAGTCCLINRNILHIEKFTGPAKICFIGLSAGFIQNLLDEVETLYFRDEQTIRTNPVFEFMQTNMGSEVIKEYQDLFPVPKNQSSHATLRDLTTRLIRALLKPGPGSTYYIKGVICELFAYLGSDFYATPVRLNATADHLLFLRIRRILEDMNGRISRAELSAILNYNGGYLNKVVQHHTGMCLFDFGMKFCFKRVEKLLLMTDYSVSEIALQMKFTNRTHFYSLFHERYGMTPQEFRKIGRKS